jgi:flagellar M-ring protein FliF
VENPGRVRRLTAAIVVNDRMAQGATKGRAPQWVPRSADELRNISALAQAAVGFDSTRGDMVTVQDLAFDENRTIEPITLQGQILSVLEKFPALVKYAALLLGLLIVVAFGVRPAVKRARPPVMAKEAKGKGAVKELPAHATPAVALPPPEPEPLDPERQRAADIFDAVTMHLKREPTQSSRLLQSWIHSD